MKDKFDRITDILKEIQNAYTLATDDWYEQLSENAVLNTRIAALESLLREVVDDPPVTGEQNRPPLCAFCGAVYDNPHTEACWITRVEKALSGEE
jgi:hypothetical protein